MYCTVVFETVQHKHLDKTIYMYDHQVVDSVQALIVLHELYYAVQGCFYLRIGRIHFTFSK